MKVFAQILILTAIGFSPIFAQDVDPCEQTAKLSQTASGVQTFTSNSNGNSSLGGSGDLAYGYEMWTEGGNNNKLIYFGPNQGGGMAFRTEWNSPTDYLGRIGFFWGKNGKKWDQFKNMYADFNYTRSDNGTGGSYSYIGIYGWTWDPMMEWYIIDDWFGSTQLGPSTLCSGSCSSLGTIEVDDGTYDIYTNTRPVGSGSIDGNDKAFPQIFSIRRMTGTRRQCGTYSITEHFKKWATISSIKDFIGKNTYEAKFLAEAGGGTGWLELSYLKMSQENDVRGSVPDGSFTVKTTASPPAGGTVTKTPNEPYYASGTSVNLTAVPATGWVFIGWDEDASGTDNPTSVTMSANKVVTAKFAPDADGAENIIKNGNFANGMTDWDLNQGEGYSNSAATANVSNGKATINISAIGKDPWEPQLAQQGIALYQGMTYRLTFKASAAAAKTIEVMLQQSASPYDAYGKNNFDLTTEEDTYTIEFEMTAPTDETVQLAFNIGASNTSVTISDVKLVYLAGDLSPIVPNKTRLTNFSLQALNGKTLLIQANAKTEAQIYDLKGNKVASINVLGGSQTVNLSLPSGVYFVKVNGMQNIKFVLK